MYSVQISEFSQSGKIIRYETVANFSEYLQAYELYFSLIYLNDSKYCYRIIEDNKTVIAESQRSDLQKI